MRADERGMAHALCIASAIQRCYAMPCMWERSTSATTHNPEHSVLTQLHAVFHHSAAALRPLRTAVFEQHAECGLGTSARLLWSLHHSTKQSCSGPTDVETEAGVSAHRSFRNLLNSALCSASTWKSRGRLSVRARLEAGAVASSLSLLGSVAASRVGNSASLCDSKPGRLLLCFAASTCASSGAGEAATVT